MLTVELTDNERRFCDEYAIDFNGTRAAIACGYSEGNAANQAYEMLKRPEVQEYLQYLKGLQSARTKITSDYVLAKIVETLERCNQEVEPLRDRKGQHVEVVTQEGEFAKAYVYDAKNVLKAAELLGKHLALFTDVVDNRMTFTQMPDAKIDLGNGQTKALTFDVGGDPNAPKSRN